MKIHIKANRHNIRLWLPTSLLKSRLVYSIITKAIQNSGKKETDVEQENSPEIPITYKQVEKMYKVLKKCIKTNGHFNIIDVQSHNGEKVKIRV